MPQYVYLTVHETPTSRRLIDTRAVQLLEPVFLNNQRCTMISFDGTRRIGSNGNFIAQHPYEEVAKLMVQ